MLLCLNTHRRVRYVTMRSQVKSIPVGSPQTHGRQGAGAKLLTDRSTWIYLHSVGALVLVFLN